MIIPAAGFGRRVGSPESKELLSDEQGRPLIQWGLDQAFLRTWPVHVIVRSEKKSLIQYLEKQKTNLGAHSELLTWQEIEASEEWPDTLLQSQKSWHEKNLVWLPDTRFAPVAALDSLASALIDHLHAYGVFRVHESKTWGILSDDIYLSEKCELQISHELDFCAWGVLAFRKSIGEKLLNLHLQSTLEQRTVSFDWGAPAKIQLDWFQDLTRGN